MLISSSDGGRWDLMSFELTLTSADIALEQLINAAFNWLYSQPTWPDRHRAHAVCCYLKSMRRAEVMAALESHRLERVCRR